MWSDFPYTGVHKGKIKKTTMKIRRKEDHFGDYTLKFSERRETLGIVTFPIILTEFQAFTSCLWLKVRPPTVPRQMNLLRYAEQDGNFSMDLRPDGKEYKIILSIWPSTQRFNTEVKYPSLDGGWHHVCTSWNSIDGRGAIFIDSSQTSFLGIGYGKKFTGGGKVFIGNTHVPDPPQLEGEITYMNLWDKVLSNASIENLALSCSAEAGNVLQWSLFAAMSVGNVQVVPFSACRAKGINCS
ncbi:unnamed protein product [Pocillopora meandrina]|uniref:Pentraxin (PTX) domain-containing protein n=1 Tax=Pocillopora meandrina TaxID=46732 RepID=A0AAU9Y5V4_9CNID|nr:unnamed protein product [Pocillopora meandrina]